MKKKDARELVPGDKLVMVCDGSYGAAFKVGDMVSFAMNENSQKMVVSGLGGGRRIDQTISRKDVELYTERPHEGLKPAPKQTRREQLIAAGVPAEELAKVVDAGLDKVAASCALISLPNAFVWIETPQGQAYWSAWHSKLNGKDAVIPEPLDAAPELYCVVFGDDNRVCSLNGSAKMQTGTLESCNLVAATMRRNFPSGNYRVMRLARA